MAQLRNWHIYASWGWPWADQPPGAKEGSSTFISSPHFQRKSDTPGQAYRQHPQPYMLVQCMAQKNKWRHKIDFCLNVTSNQTNFSMWYFQLQYCAAQYCTVLYGTYYNPRSLLFLRSCQWMRRLRAFLFCLPSWTSLFASRMPPSVAFAST